MTDSHENPQTPQETLDNQVTSRREFGAPMIGYAATVPVVGGGEAALLALPVVVVPGKHYRGE